MTSKMLFPRESTRLSGRAEPRVHGVRQITVLYEGHKEKIVVKPPDLSAHGMFISTHRVFPEGAVLNLAFQLAGSGVEVETRAEVRYCLPGVGVGVEFIDLLPEAQEEIALEIKHKTQPSTRRIAKPRTRKR